MKRRQVSKILGGNSYVSEGEVFWDYLTPLSGKGRLLEIGTGVGHSTVFLSKLKPKWTIYTVDAYGLYGEKSIFKSFNTKDLKDTLRVFEERENITMIIGDSKKIAWEIPVDVLYIDGDHRYEGVRADFMKYSPFVKKYIIFDDYWRDDFGVKKLVDSLKKWKALYKNKIAIVERK